MRGEISSLSCGGEDHMQAACRTSGQVWDGGGEQEARMLARSLRSSAYGYDTRKAVSESRQ